MTSRAMPFQRSNAAVNRAFQITQDHGVSPSLLARDVVEDYFPRLKLPTLKDFLNVRIRPIRPTL
jgi:hypothetical protein